MKFSGFKSKPEKGSLYFTELLKGDRAVDVWADAREKEKAKKQAKQDTSKRLNQPTTGQRPI